MEYEIPIVGTTIDTDDPAESAKSFGGAVLGILSLTAAAAVATFSYQRLKSVAGVDGETVDVGAV